ncbi:cytochrome P460 family protein [Thermus neutrinimicus]|uniref:cytochrome P460 family protein n=1 Tax=Thermus neutrinimicus TaxID=2908149 RepID=UPI001FAA1019|nr:cytochrome P460 family protein [Thermus neutrinimicus]
MMWRLKAVLGVLAIGGSILALAQAVDQDKAFAQRLWRLMAGASGEDYRLSWHYIPGKPMGFYRGTEPHGSLLRTFVNSIAFDAINAKVGEYPVGSVIVKDNHMPDGKLDGVTAMVKQAKGYDPNNGDWFWVKYTPTGKVELAGKVRMCSSCHAQARGQDYVFSTAIR